MVSLQASQHAPPRMVSRRAAELHHGTTGAVSTRLVKQGLGRQMVSRRADTTGAVSTPARNCRGRREKLPTRRKTGSIRGGPANRRHWHGRGFRARPGPARPGTPGLPRMGIQCARLKCVIKASERFAALLRSIGHGRAGTAWAGRAGIAVGRQGRNCRGPAGPERRGPEGPERRGPAGPERRGPAGQERRGPAGQNIAIGPWSPFP